MVDVRSDFKVAKQRVKDANSAETVCTEALDFLTVNAKINKQQADYFLKEVEKKLQSFNAIARYEMLLNAISPLSYNLTELVEVRREALAHIKEAAPVLLQNAKILLRAVEAEPK
jgi:hypothetical protein